MRKYQLFCPVASCGSIVTASAAAAIAVSFGLWAQKDFCKTPPTKRQYGHERQHSLIQYQFPRKDQTSSAF